MTPLLWALVALAVLALGWAARRERTKPEPKGWEDNPGDPRYLEMIRRHEAVESGRRRRE